MKKRVLSMLLVLVMVLACLPVTARADAAENIYVYSPTYYNNSGALATISTKFDWTSGAVTGRLILSSKELPGGKGEEYNNNKYGAFTNYGIYASSFSNYAAAKSEDDNNQTFGFITASDETSISNGATATMTLSVDDGKIPMNQDATYYVYLWVQYNGKFYPDNLICVIQVANNTLKYTPAKKPATTNNGFDKNHYRNYYEDSFQVVPNEAPSGAHQCQPSKWLWDDTYHWQMKCSDPACANRTVKIYQQAHTFTSAQDTTCDCGYTRTAPAEKPATGDITNIPMWTMLFFGGLALLWVQLEQRKRQQF